MQFVDTSIYRGPNVYALFPVIRHTVDLGVLEEWPTARIGREFVDALVDALPGLAEHGCSYREPGGLVRRMLEDEGTWMGHVLEHVVLELQSIAGYEVTFGKTRSTDERGVYDMVFEYEEEFAGIEAGKLALDLLHSLLPESLRPDEAPRDFDFASERDDFIRACQSRSLGPSTHALVKEAEARDVPWIRLNDHSLIQLGHGRYQRRLQATITSETPHIAVELASEKDETNRILGDLGLPVPRQALVYRLRRAIRAAERIGYPVVLKPLNANHGRGVTTDIRDEDAARKGLRQGQGAQRRGDRRDLPRGPGPPPARGRRQARRGGQARAGACRRRWQSTIEELVERVNEDPRRGVGHEKVLTRITLDAAARAHARAARHGRAERARRREIVYLQPTANLSTGGTAVDVTDVIHPDNRVMAERAILALGLDVGGVDFITTDITRSYREVGGGICECNAAPGFRMHVAPSEGEPRNVAGPVIDMLFPEGTIAHSHRGDHRHQRQDHDLADAGAHPQDVRADRRPDQHRRCLHRRAAHGAGRHDRSHRRADRAARPVRRRRGHGDGAWRHHPQRSGLSQLECLCLPEHRRRSPGPERREHAGGSRRGQARGGGGGQGRGGAERRRQALPADGRPLYRRSLCYVTMNRNHPLVREHVAPAARRWCWSRGSTAT
jgi:cyanophycin synthetase